MIVGNCVKAISATFVKPCIWAMATQKKKENEKISDYVHEAQILEKAIDQSN